MQLDKEVAQVFSVFGLLLVFAIAYFTALLPTTDALVEGPIPQVDLDRNNLRSRVRTQRRLTLILGSVVLAIFMLAAPLTFRVAKRVRFHAPFSTLRAGFLLTQLLLLLTVIWIVVLAKSLNDRHKALKERPQPLGKGPP